MNRDKNQYVWTDMSHAQWVGIQPYATWPQIYGCMMIDRLRSAVLVSPIPKCQSMAGGFSIRQSKKQPQRYENLAFLPVAMVTSFLKVRTLVVAKVVHLLASSVQSYLHVFLIKVIYEPFKHHLFFLRVIIPLNVNQCKERKQQEK